MGSGSRLLVFVVFVLVVVATSSVTATLMKTSGVSDEVLGKKIADFVVKNPEVIARSLQRAQAQQQEQEAQDAQKNIGDSRKELENDSGTPFMGNPKGDVVVVKFNDYNCGFCKRVAPEIEKAIAADKNLKVVIKEFPILGESSEKAARAAQAVFFFAPEKYAEFHHALMNANIRDENSIYTEAKKLGIDADRLKKEMNSEKVVAQIQKHQALGQKIGVRGTPTFVINGELQRKQTSADTIKEEAAKFRSAH